jgi:tryptophanyl-tRNA synthetase
MKKMSKSLGNAIFLSDDEQTVERRVMSMFTDPTRLHATDPGHVRGNPVFAYHDAFNPDTGEVNDLKRRYRAGKVGDVEVKRKLARALNEFLAPIRERRAAVASEPGLVERIIREGSERAQSEAAETLRQMKHAMKFDFWAPNGAEPVTTGPAEPARD